MQVKGRNILSRVIFDTDRCKNNYAKKNWKVIDLQITATNARLNFFSLINKVNVEKSNVLDSFSKMTLIQTVFLWTEKYLIGNLYFYEFSKICPRLS